MGLPEIAVPLLFALAIAIILKLADNLVGRPARRAERETRVRELAAARDLEAARDLDRVREILGGRVGPLEMLAPSPAPAGQEAFVSRDYERLWREAKETEARLMRELGDAIAEANRCRARWIEAARREREGEN